MVLPQSRKYALSLFFSTFEIEIIRYNFRIAQQSLEAEASGETPTA